jgi:hypothetical protein
MSTPIPRPAPVTSHTFLSVICLHVLSVGLPVHRRVGHHGIGGALSTQPAAGGRWETLMRGVLAGTPSDAGTLLQIFAVVGDL